MVMDTDETQVRLLDWLDSGNSNHWVKLNAGFKGFYGVCYRRDSLIELDQPCRSKAIVQLIS